MLERTIQGSDLLPVQPQSSRMVPLELKEVTLPMSCSRPIRPEYHELVSFLALSSSGDVKGGRATHLAAAVGLASPS
jgi:hypothetical protein